MPWAAFNSGKPYVRPETVLYRRLDLYACKQSITECRGRSTYNDLLWDTTDGLNFNRITLRRIPSYRITALD